MSRLVPPAPPWGWWIMTRPLGRICRLPFVPPARSTAPIEAHWPTHTVCTSQRTNFIAS
jgi:hypothetical protein